MSDDSTPRRPTIVLTGASSGIGALAARELARAGAHLAVVGRNPERTRAVAASITDAGGSARAHLADFDRLDDVRALGAELLETYPEIDVLANNAGGLVPNRAITVDGFERTFQSNHLAPFLLTSLLLPRLTATAESTGDARIVSTASVANRFGRIDLADLQYDRRRWFGGWPAYGSSKLETILFVRELAERLSATDVTAYSFHPGFVATEFGKDSRLMRAYATLSRGQYGISAEAGAVPLIRLCSVEGLDGGSRPPAPSGTYFDGLKPAGRTAKQAVDPQLRRDLWQASERMLGAR